MEAGRRPALLLLPLRLEPPPGRLLHDVLERDAVVDGGLLQLPVELVGPVADHEGCQGLPPGASYTSAISYIVSRGIFARPRQGPAWLLARPSSRWPGLFLWTDRKTGTRLAWGLTSGGACAYSA